MKTYTSNRETINVIKDDLFCIKLDSIPSCGYKWISKFDEAFIKEVEHKFHGKENVIGGSGYEKFIFQGIKGGNCKIIMEYKRPWSQKIIKEQTFDIKISEALIERKK